MAQPAPDQDAQREARLRELALLLYQGARQAVERRRATAQAERKADDKPTSEPK